MADIEKVIKGLECCYCNYPKTMDCKNCPYDKICYHDKDCSLMLRDALELLKDYRQHLQNDLETLTEEKRRLELEHEVKAFIYKEKDGLMTIKMNL